MSGFFRNVAKVLRETILVGLCSLAIGPSGAAPLTDFGSVYALGDEGRARGGVIDLRAQVTYADPGWNILFLEDAPGTRYYMSHDRPELKITAGDVVRLQAEFNADSDLERISSFEVSTVEVDRPLVVPKRVSLGEVGVNAGDPTLVTTTGEVYWFERLDDHLRMLIGDSGHRVLLTMLCPPDTSAEQWDAATIEVTGVPVENSDELHVTSVGIMVQSPSQVRVLGRPRVRPFELPLQAIGGVPETLDGDQRWRFQGKVVWNGAGNTVTVRDDTGTLTARLLRAVELPVGDRVDIVGIPRRQGGRVVLTDAVVRLTNTGSGETGAPIDTNVSADESLPVLTTVEAVRRLSADEALRRYPVRIEAVATYHVPEWRNLFVQDDTAGIFVAGAPTDGPAYGGQRVRIEGTTDRGGFAPIIVALKITPAGEAGMPASRVHLANELALGWMDSQWVEVRGVVRSARMHQGGATLRMADDSGVFEVQVRGELEPEEYRGAEIGVHGVVGSKFNANRQLIGFEVRADSTSAIRIISPRPSTEDVPVRSLISLLQFDGSTSRKHLLRAEGVVLLVRPDRSFFLQDDTFATLVIPEQPTDAEVGDRVSVLGYSSYDLLYPAIEAVGVEVVGSGEVPTARALAVDAMLDPGLHQQYVRVRGTVLNSITHSDNMIHTVLAGGWTFDASQPLDDNARGAGLQPGSLVEMGGIYFVERDPLGNPEGFRLEVGGSESIQVIGEPGWWTNRRIAVAAVALSLGVLGVGGWGWTLNRGNRRLRREIVERREAECRLKYEQSLLNVIMESSADLIYFKDDEHRFIRVNQALAGSHGFTSPEEMVGKTDHDLFAAEVADGFRADEKVVMETGQPIIGKEEFEQTLDGARRWSMTTSVPYRDATGKIIGILGITRDITARKEASEELDAQRREYQTIFQSMPIMLIYKDRKNRLVRVNDMAARMLERSVDELVGKSLYDLNPGFADRAYRSDLEVLHSGNPRLGIDENFVSASGREYWMRVDKIPHLDRTGEIVGVLVFGIDITGRKLAELDLRKTHDELEATVARRTASLQQEIRERRGAEERLREQEEFIRHIIDADPNLIFVKDEEGRFVLVNRALADAMGRSVEELIGQTDEVLHHSRSEIEQFRLIDKEVLSTGREKRGEESLKDARGKPLWLQTVKRPIPSPDGQRRFLLGVSVDITERKLREEEARRMQTFLNSVVENLPITVFIKEAKDLSFVLWNRAGQELTGYTNDEMLGRNDYDFFPEEEARKFIEMDRAALAEGRLIDVPEEVLDTRHKGQRIMHTRKIPIFDEHGRPAYLLGITEDITDRKAAETALLTAKNEAQEANRSKSEFLANMSHEIRTPMNGVIGMVNLLLDTQLDKEQRDYAETVRESAEGLLTVINDILDFSKMEAGKLHFEHLDFNLHHVVDGALELLSEKARGKGIELGALIHHDVDPCLAGDPGRLRQVLLNLLGNAVKFTSEGHVALEVSLAAREGDTVRLRFEIKDTGPGIPADVQAKLFQPFVQADGSTTRKFGGTGLGLVISRQIVECMQGEVGLVSEEGVGSTFWFTVLLKERPMPATCGVASDENLRGLRVLIVDDSEINRRIVQHNVTSWRMRGDCADGADEAMRLMRTAVSENRPYDIALLDMDMPNRDGLDLAGEIQADIRLKSTPLVLLTSLGQVLPAEELRQRGIVASLVKPIKQQDLLNAMVDVLSGADRPYSRQSSRTSLEPTDTPAVDGRLASVKVLVAEDNLVNQKVLTGTLAKLGFAADCVANGREAVDAAGVRDYDVILMDCQMPEMDGYEASRLIRQQEIVRQPYVIAITANAMKGDAEKCLAAGMDAYLSKPVRQAELRLALEKAMNAKFGEDAETGGTGSPTAGDAIEAVLDMEALDAIRDLGEPGEPDALSEIIDLFLQDAPEYVRRLREAVAAGDFSAIERDAHTLKGSGRNLGATRLGAACHDLEQHAVGRSPDACRRSLPGVEAAYAEAESALIRVKRGEAVAGDPAGA